MVPRYRSVRRGGAFVLSLVELAGAGVVLATAHYGGQLVYGLGVNVMTAG